MLRPNPRFGKRSISLALLSTFAACSSPVVANDLALRDTVVTATRHETEIDKISATVSSVGRQQMDRRLPVDDSDLFRDEPDVSLARDLRRHGSTRVNIRGIEDNRVVQMVDGVRLPDFYNGGGPTNYTMNAASAPMPDFMRQVEIVRGPASSLYGSDALGGVVGYITLDPSDIASGDKKQGLRLRGSYFGTSETFSGSLIGALRSDMIDVLLAYAQARGEETKNQGDNERFGPTRSTANPATSDDRGALAKFILRPAVGHKLSAMFEGREQETQTDIMRVPASMSKVSAMRGDDESRRVRVSLEYEHAASGWFYDRLIARVYNQNAETHNQNYQRRANARYSAATGCSASSGSAPTANCDINQDFYFEQQTSGFGLQLESIFQLGSTSHLLTYGIDLMRQRVEEKRDGRVVNVTTGAITQALAGERYPLRDFANGTTDTVGLFAQDEIGLFGGRLALTPGIRYDYTKLKPEMDALARQVLTTIQRQTSEQEHSAVSPKLGAQWKFTEALSTYGQIAAGFRAPNYSEVNGAFLNSSQLYAFSPNPDLKPETSIGVELGLRARSTTARGQLALFDNRYKDFIENNPLKCPGDPRCITAGGATYKTYMYENLAKVRIYGAELRGSWDFMPHWRLDGGIAYAHGENEDSKQPLNSVEPLKASLGLAYDAGQWGGEGRLRGATHKNRVDESASTYFKTPGYAVTDLSAWFKPSKGTQIVVAVNNLLDQKYWLWSDIRQAESNATYVDFYTQPGRNLRLSFQADF